MVLCHIYLAFSVFKILPCTSSYVPRIWYITNDQASDDSMANDRQGY